MEVIVRTMLTLLFLFCLAPLARPQAPAPPAEVMKKLDFLVGHWEGEGWMMVGPGQRHTAKVTETVQRKLDGTVLLVEGVGRGVVAGQERIVHNALGVINYDRQAGGFRMRAYRAEGQQVDAEIKLGDNQIVWGFEDPRAGRIRFTMQVNKQGQWQEFGEASRDGGKTWFKFMEMTLDRKK
jgi:hypothetical protein